MTRRRWFQDFFINGMKFIRLTDGTESNALTYIIVLGVSIPPRPDPADPRHSPGVVGHSFCSRLEHVIWNRTLSQAFQNTAVKWLSTHEGETDMRYIGLWLLGVPVVGIVGLKLFGLI